MSLLMDALKKAEQAKQGPNSVFGDTQPAAAAPAESGPPTEWPVLSIDPSPAEIEQELGLPSGPAPLAHAGPDMPPPAVLALDPLPPREDAPPATRAPMQEPAPAGRPVQDTRAADKGSESAQAADRLAARGVFAAKKTSGAGAGTRTPFYVVLGLLLAAGMGAALYVWSEMQTPAPLSAKGPAPSAGGMINTAPTTPTTPREAAPAAAPPGPTVPQNLPVTEPQTQAPVAAGTAPPAPAQPAPGPPAAVPAMASTPNPPPSAAAQPGPATANPPSPAYRAEPRTAATSADRVTASAQGGTPVAPPANLRITRERAAPGIDPFVNAGYSALSEGNLESAREHYNRALAADATNRDALLGLAAVATRSGRGDVAENLYQRVLELHPRDPYASTQLTTLRNGGDAAASESKVKALLAGEREPSGAAPLHFALGNQMAAQGRWAEAQQAYFNAFTGDPDNPDFCYNLAVSLDQLHQPKLALDHYTRAIALATKRRAGFDVARAKARLEQLSTATK